uniref:Uncharacterized protein n=1 Tax=Zea mays TaxID=4577 RepID=B6T7K1_MAIZE|nr:hypothetical protein [Zea mays]
MRRENGFECLEMLHLMCIGWEGRVSSMFWLRVFIAPNNQKSPWKNPAKIALSGGASDREWCVSGAPPVMVSETRGQ